MNEFLFVRASIRLFQTVCRSVEVLHIDLTIYCLFSVSFFIAYFILSTVVRIM